MTMVIDLELSKVERRLWLLLLWASVAATSALVVALIRIIMALDQTKHHLAGML